MTSVAIVGCGPAGLSAAIALHDAGLQVCLFEQFDQPKPVGSGLMLQPTGLCVLERWGLRAHVEKLGQRIDGMLGRVAPNGKVVLDIAYDAMSRKGEESLYGVAIHRAALFHVLYEAAKARAIAVHTNKRIQSASFAETTSLGTQSAVQLFDNMNKPVSQTFDFVVDASGTQSQFAKTLAGRSSIKELAYGALWTTVKLGESGFDGALLEQRYRAANVMVGILPCGRLPNETTPLATLFWSIRADHYDAFVTNGLSAWKADVCKVWPAVSSLLDGIENIEQLNFATYAHHTLKKPYVPGIVFIGDAAHATSPQLGQGANMAMLDAYALAKAIDKSHKFEEFAPLYARMRCRHVKLFQTASSALTPFYQSDSRILPAIRDTFFESASALPFARKMVTSLGAGLLTQPIRRIDRLSQ